VGLRSGSSSREGPLTNSTASNGHLQAPSALKDLVLQPGGSKKPLTGSFSSNGDCQIVISSDHFTLDRPCTYCTAVVCPPQSRFNKKGRFRRWCTCGACPGGAAVYCLCCACCCHLFYSWCRLATMGWSGGKATGETETEGTAKETETKR
jgi:hypothetical protein